MGRVFQVSVGVVVFATDHVDVVCPVALATVCVGDRLEEGGGGWTGIFVGIQKGFYICNIIHAAIHSVQ